MGNKVVLDADVHVSVVAQYNEGVSIAQLAKVVGVTFPTMRRILKEAGCIIRPGSRSKLRPQRPVPGVVGLKETARDRQVKVDYLRQVHERRLREVKDHRGNRTGKRMAREAAVEEEGARDPGETSPKIVQW